MLPADPKHQESLQMKYDVVTCFYAVVTCSGTWAPQRRPGIGSSWWHLMSALQTIRVSAAQSPRSRDDRQRGERTTQGEETLCRRAKKDLILSVSVWESLAGRQEGRKA